MIRRTSTLLMLASIALTSWACSAANPKLVVPMQGRLVSTNAPTLWSMFKDKQDNITPIPIGKTEAMSYQLVVIHDRERQHIHAQHDLAVTILEGAGVLHLKDRQIPMQAGDVSVIQRGTPHYFVNTGSQPVSAFVVSSPPYDPKDSIPVR